MERKLNRQILFDKKSQSSVIPSENQNPVPPKSPPKIERPPITEIRHDTAKKIVEWINSHEMFKWSKMCLKIGIDKGNFARVLQSEDPIITEENKVKIIDIIKKYGYA